MRHEDSDGVAPSHVPFGEGVGIAPAIWMLAAAGAIAVYAYVFYPAALRVASAVRGRRTLPSPPDEWPLISITVPVYNEERSIRGTLESLLQADYPADRRHILVVSDASTDRTDRIVQEFTPRGVRLVRLPRRSGKTAAENTALPHLRGAIVVNTDASVRIDPGALKPLVHAFADPTVGVASGRDISVGNVAEDPNVGESTYVGYEMWVRDLETRVYGIVGASGCFYASRVALHRELVPAALSRDFAAPLIAREQGYRAVSVNDARCFVPRATSLRREYRRKVRTMTRGLETLFYKRHLLNPLRYGTFAWMLLSHKLARWLVPWAAVASVVAIVLLAGSGGAVGALAAIALGALGVLAAIAWSWPDKRPLPKVVAVPAYSVFGIVAGLHAWTNALRGELNPVWEPTRRNVADGAPSPRRGDRAG